VIVRSIGHSTLEAAALVETLQAHGVACVADVRRFPASRRHPQFNGAALARTLAAHGLRYAHFEALGGRREPQPHSRNLGWREAGFRGYADHMETPAFAAAMDRLLGLAAEAPTALLCAEKDWRHCHRGLVADWLKARGVEVLHIVDAQRAEPQPYTAAAVAADGTLTYPAPGAGQGALDLGI
jgi:uncharacterized protein (DUF488 family)